MAKKIVSKPDDDCLQNIKPEENEMEFIPVDQAIKQLKNGKAAGPDKVPTTIIKDLGDLEAFDTVDHKIMVEKLRRYGIRNTAGN